MTKTAGRMMSNAFQKDGIRLRESGKEALDSFVSGRKAKIEKGAVYEHW